MSIRKFADEDTLALGGLMGVLMLGQQAAPDRDIEVIQYKDEDGYYEDFFDVVIHGRRLRLRVETTSAADSAADLVELLSELT